MIQRNYLSVSLITVLGFVIVVSGCGGSASSGSIDLQDDPIVQQDQSTQCMADDASRSTQDVAELLFTESDRQWSCEIVFDGGVRFEDIYFSRSGFASLGSDNAWFWNRRLADDAINLLSPTLGSLVLQQIYSSNTTLTFTSASDVGLRESYDCVMVAREIENTQL